MSTVTIATLAAEITARATGPKRFLVALSGPPASGKSTLAAMLATRIGDAAAVLPMDGFHLDNAQLEKMGLLHRKGAPQTFDAAGFTALVHRLARDASVPYPTFDRTADSTVPDGGRIEPDTRIVLIEGNYLLLNTPPWTGLADLFDLTVHLKTDPKELEARLISRWLDHGLSPQDARARALDNDMKNVAFVEENSHPAEFTLETGS